MGEPFPFASAIMTDEPAWEDAFVRAASEWGYTLADGVLSNRDGEIGKYAFVPREQFAGKPWHAERSPCPFVGPLRGYLCFGIYCWIDDAERELARDFAITLVKEGRGNIARRSDDRFVVPVHERTYALAGALEKYGIDDGSALLTRDAESPYVAYVQAQAYAAIGGAGLEAHLSWSFTSHNPLRLSRVMPEGDTRLYPALFREGGDRVPEDEVDALLRSLKLTIWTYDFSVTRDAEFWRSDFAG